MSLYRGAPRWTAEEIETARTLHARGRTLAEIGAAIGRSASAVESKLERPDDAGPKQPPPDPQARRDREPCPRCQVRGDMGCAHRPAGEQAPKLTSRA